MITPRASTTTIILERVHNDASGNNDRQRELVERMTIEEAKAFAGRLAKVIGDAEEALALERMTRLAKVEAEIEEIDRRRAALDAERRRLEGVSAPREEPPASPVQHREGFATLSALSPCLAMALAAPPGVLTAASPVTPAPAEIDPDMPAFLRRTA